MKKRKNEFFIGMVDGFSGGKNYSSKRRKKAKRKLFFKRFLIILLCLAIIAGVAGSIYHFVIPAVGSLFATSTADEASVDEATPDETTPDEAATEATATEPTKPEPQKPASQDVNTFNRPTIKDDGTKGTYLTDSLYLYKKSVYNLFGSNDKIEKNYSDTINAMAKTLDKDVTVYSMVVPNHTEFGLPTRLCEELGSHSQADNIKALYSGLDSRVQPINCYNALSAHADEYLYYNTDHHWTSLGAYYAYTAFCEQTGQEPVDIKTLEKNSIPGFVGSFYTLTGNSTVYKNADTVDYYTLPNDTSALMRERMDSSFISCDVYYSAATAGDLTYGVFCWGDTAQFIINSYANTGRKIVIVKDSYGNAFAPYLTANYNEIHLLDFRYFTGNLNDYLEYYGIDEVMFLNNTMSANTPSQIASMQSALS